MFGELPHNSLEHDIRHKLLDLVGVLRVHQIQHDKVADCVNLRSMVKLDLLCSVTLGEKLTSFLLKLSLEPDCRASTLRELASFLFAESEEQSVRPQSVGSPRISSSSYSGSVLSSLCH